MRRRQVALGPGVVALSLLLLGVPARTNAGLLSIAVNDTYSVRHDRQLSVGAPGVLRNDVDVSLTGGTSVDLVRGVSNGTLNLAANGGFTYLPRSGYVGTDSFQYRISGLLTTPATVTISVTNAAPVATDDSFTVTPGRTLSVAAPGVLSNDSDADGDAITVDDESGVSGSLKLNANGGFTYTPNGGFSGSTSFTYTITDGISTSTATVRLTSAPAPTPTPALTPAPTPTPTPQPIVLPSLPLPTLPPIVVPTLPPIVAPTLSPIVAPTLPLPTLPPLLPTATPAPSAGIPLPTRSPAATGSLSPLPTSAAPGANVASPTPSQGPSTVGGTPQPPSAGGDGGAQPVAVAIPVSGSSAGELDVRTAAERDDGGLDVPFVGSLTFGQLWWVPAATIGGPGLLVILFIALQFVGGIVWLPATRRFRRNPPPAGSTVTPVSPSD